MIFPVWENGVGKPFHTVQNSHSYAVIAKYFVRNYNELHVGKVLEGRCSIQLSYGRLTCSACILILSAQNREASSPETFYYNTFPRLSIANVIFSNYSAINEEMNGLASSNTYCFRIFSSDLTVLSVDGHLGQSIQTIGLLSTWSRCHGN